MTEGKFTKLENGDDAGFGPESILVCGFPEQASPSLGSLLKSICAEQHRVQLCSKAMLAQNLGQALLTEDPDEPAAPDQLPRVMILSGLSNRQIHDFVDRFSSTGLPRPIFASTTPTNLDMPLRTLLLALLKEHQVMSEKP